MSMRPDHPERLLCRTLERWSSTFCFAIDPTPQLLVARESPFSGHLLLVFATGLDLFSCTWKAAIDFGNQLPAVDELAFANGTAHSPSTPPYG